MPRFVKYKLTSAIGSNSYDAIFLAPPEHYPTDIAALTGVSEVVEGSDEDQLPVVKTESLLQSSLATKRKVRLRVGTGGTATYKYASIVLAQSKLGDFEAGVITATYKGGTVVAIVESLDATFY